MAREFRHVVLIVVVLVSAHLGESAPQNWVPDLREIRDITFNIQKELQQVRENLRKTLTETHEEVRRTIASLPKDPQGQVITSGSANSISLSFINGISKTVISGYTPTGESYVRKIEEQNDGKYLYHDETVHNLATNNTERIRWKLDLTKPNAKPEYFKGEDAKSEISKDVEVVEPYITKEDGKSEK